jgi:hypothetical protein
MDKYTRLPITAALAKEASLIATWGISCKNRVYYGLANITI